MRKTLFCWAVGSTLILLAACAQTPLPEVATAASVENDRRETQVASVYISDGLGGCEYRGIETFYIQNEFKQPKTEASLFYIIFGSFECDGSYVFGEYEAVEPTLEDVGFSFDKNLKTATLTATFEVAACSLVDGSERCAPAGAAEASVNWTGVGDPARDTNYLFHTRVLGSKRTLRGHGTRREATATVTVSYGDKTAKLAYPNGEEGGAFLRSGRYSKHTVE